MAESGNGITKQTLFISIAAALLIGFLSGIIYSDRSPGPGGVAQQQQQGQPPPQQNQLEQTIASLQLAAQQNPNNAEIWTQLGHAYFDSDQAVKAIEAYTKSLAIIPNNPPVLTDLGVMYRRNGQPDKAIEMFDKALEINPALEQAMFNKGIVLYNDLGDVNGAIENWKSLLQINPDARGPSGIPVSTMVDDLSKQVQDP
jgi:cytochrome c-type biogenesis protein CcmH/NrfG